MKRHKGPSTKGSALVGVTIGAGLIGIVSLGIATLIGDIWKAQNSAKALSEINNFQEEVRAHLTNQQACLNTFGGAARDYRAPHPKIFSIDHVKNGENPATTTPTNRYLLNTAYGSGSFEIASIRIQYPSPLNSPVDPNEALASFTYRPRGQVLGPNQLKPREIILGVKFNGVGVMTECIPKSRMTDGIWQRVVSEPSRIFYNEGNVGIGVANPTRIFEVAPTSAAAAASTEGNGITITAQDAGAGGTSPGGSILLNAGAANFGGAPGFVGINTTMPGTLHPGGSGKFGIAIRGLEISGAAMNGSASHGALLLTSNRPTPTGADGIGRIVFASKNDIGNTHGAVEITAGLSGSGGTNGFGGSLSITTKRDNMSGLNTVMHLSRDGQVGIGTTSPAAPLHVLANTTTTIFERTGKRLSFDPNNVDANTWSQIQTDTGMGLFFRTNGGLQEPLVLTAAGNVGIGTSAPNYRLHVSSSTPSTWSMYVRNTAFAASSSHAIVGMGCAGHENCYGVVGIAGDNGIASGVIGQSADDGIYGILGYKRIYSFYGNTNAYLGAGSWQGSDARLKENIKPIDAALERVLKLEPVRFDWKKDSDAYRGGQRTSYGFIAQDLEKVFPETVSEIQAPKRDVKSGSAPLSINERLSSFKIAQYDKLVAVAIAAVQEAWTIGAARDEELTTRVERLEKENARLRAAVCEINPTAGVCRENGAAR